MTRKKPSSNTPPLTRKEIQKQYRQRLFLAMRCYYCRAKTFETYCNKCKERRRIMAIEYRKRKKQI